MQGAKEKIVPSIGADFPTVRQAPVRLVGRTCAAVQTLRDAPAMARKRAQATKGHGPCVGQAAMDLAIDSMQQDVAVVVLPFEELDAGNASEFKRDIGAILESQVKLVFDLTRVRFVDSSGLGAFLSCLRRVNARGGDLKLCGLSSAVRSVFELVRMHRVFDIQSTREAAVRAFAAPAKTADRGAPA